MACTCRVYGLYRRTRAANTAVYTYTNVCTAVYKRRTRPCRRSCTRVHGHVYGPCTRPNTAVYRPCTAVYGRYTAVYTAVYKWRTRSCTHVHGCVYGPCTRPVHGRVQAVYAARTGRVRPVHGRVHGLVHVCRSSTCVHGRVYNRAHGPYTRVYGPCARPCRWAVKTVVYATVYTWPCTGRVHGGYTATV